MAIKTAEPVTVSLADLQANRIPFSTLLAAFGPDSLGILVVRDLPSTFPALRSSVLANASRLAALPASTLQTLTKPAAKYLVGWSHGVETLRPGVVDTAKGSYYLNCAFYQDPTLEAPRAANDERWNGFEEYTAGNVWPAEADVPEFRTVVESLITLVIDTAVLVARACDAYAEREVPGYAAGYLEKVVRESTTTKARLLHYFPSATEETRDETTPAASVDGENSSESDGESDDWCATHLDHGCLTGLTSAMFVDETADDAAFPENVAELPASPSPKSGLYIKSRGGEVFKVAIPRDCLAFQTGETLELITQGRFKAVPHFVRGVDAKDLREQGKEGMRVARNTLAVFTQPDLGAVVDPRTGLTFGEFARGVVGRNTTAGG
ncbi:uncharacterized protein HMPREF1541_09170 [Cyphellophora europaea CBS 101466]|uniref:Clavaminate synthase-like protein n=1 Tax=Cyphellophora europaea (strain CBS 101466) TaxID=1220924 RepID=W2SBN7_CYPE1|nr:uncharacterized protein HMPREF1541_09170 [Cyphellophora europaea CBS 101466]ETN45339.1 hypothetical protein HMPREF1541_09170 [Cyphellophora europaea CBS 101466]